MRPLATALLGLALAGCLPNPQSVKEHREHFDRDSIRGSLLLDALPSDAKKVGAVFGDRIELVGYRLDPVTPKRGDTVTVTLYWSAQRPINEDYMVFVHGDAIVGNARRIHGDHYPAKGKYPTDVWQSGEVVADPFEIRIDGDYGAPQLGINVGLYLGNYRVPLTHRGSAFADGENRSRAIEISF